MRERGIIFSAPMVRALLAGRKTVTRRLIRTPPPDRGFPELAPEECGTIWHWRRRDGACEWHVDCPHGRPGDRLWVREAWGVATDGSGWANGGVTLNYRADGGQVPVDAKSFNLPETVGTLRDWRETWRSPLHMPRWASRIVREIVSIRPERLQAITDADVLAEGAVLQAGADVGLNPGLLLSAMDGIWYGPSGSAARDLFAAGWAALHGADSWASNPWVWRIEMREPAVAPTAEHTAEHKIGGGVAT